MENQCKLKISVRRKIVNATIAGILAVGMLAPLQAAAYVNSESVSINTDELKTPHGIEMVYARIQHKAKSVCEAPGLQPLEVTRHETTCKVSFVNDLVQQVNHSGLTDYHNTVLEEGKT